MERSGGEDWPDRLVEVLGQASTLAVVVDNAEHVIDAVATLVAQILGATNITVLATSRTPLGIPGEALCPIEPLDAEAAVDLFNQRARDANPTWVPTPANS